MKKIDGPNVEALPGVAGGKKGEINSIALCVRNQLPSF